MFDVLVGKRVEKNLKKLPLEVQNLFRALKIDLQADGPVQPSWQNYSKLGKDKYHCHLNYHYVACWKNKNNTITIEVYYVGSREKSPY